MKVWMIELIMLLSLCSFMFAIVVGIAEIAGVLRNDYLGIGMIALAVAQAIIALIAPNIYMKGGKE